MKHKKIIWGLAIVVILLAIVVIRLGYNKKKLDEKMQLVTQFNTTVPVQTDTVKTLNASGSFVSTGTFEPYQQTTIISETQGKVIAINAQIGTKVSQGQTLLKVDDKVLKSQLDVAKYTLEKAEKDLQRYEQMLKTEAITQQQYELAKQAYISAQANSIALKDQYEKTTVKAPFSGTITKRYIEKGTFLQSGTQLFDMVSINKIKLVVKLTEDEVANVTKAERVMITTNMYPNTNFTGEVKGIVVKADGSKRYDVEIEVANQSGKLIKPGMFGTVTFNKSGQESALVIQRKALTGSVKEPQVFVIKGDSVELKDIEVEYLNDKYLIVKNGLNLGEIIVVSGQINLVSGSKVKINR